MRFQSLPSQVAEHLKEEIANGRWVSFLPGERSLAESLQISRRTLTAALAQLRRNGVIRSVPARGHKIVPVANEKPDETPRLVGLLSSDPVDLLRPGATLWVKDLHALMAEANVRLNFFHGHRYHSRQPGRALAKLVSANPQSCWLLVQSGEATQSWFAKQGLPALVAGTSHPGIALPDHDLDFHALGRHAAGRLAAHHHRRAALFFSDAPGSVASEVECEQGFREVFERSGGTAVVAYHERSRDGLIRAMRRFLNGSDRPTAFVVTNSLDYLTATSFLAQAGFRIPQDLSVVARNNDSFLSALLPVPTRYAISPHVIARKIFKLLMQVVEGETPSRNQARIMPDFIAGESLGPAPEPGVKP